MDAFLEVGDFPGVAGLGGFGLGLQVGDYLPEATLASPTMPTEAGVVLADFGGVCIYLDDVFGEGEALLDGAVVGHCGADD